MKKTRGLLAALAMALALTACQQNSYKLAGTASGLNEGDTLLLTTDLETGIASDTLIVKDGKFQTSGPVDSVQLALIYVQGHPEASAMFFMEPGTISVELSAEPGHSRVSGTKANNGWQELADMSNEYGEQAQQKMQALYDENITDEQRQAVFNELQQLESAMMQKMLEATEKNIDNELGFFLVTNLSGNEETFTPEKRRELIEKMPAKFRQREAIKQMEEELKAAESTAVGQKISDFTLNTPDGQPLGIMSEVARHELTILDFWASWCGPCREEMPFMVELYNKYHEQGLGIVGISLDEDHDAWTNAISELGIQWPQMSDLKGWKSSAGQLFQVNSIPFMVIVDKDGTIVEKGLRGPKLEEFIGSHLK